MSTQHALYDLSGPSPDAAGVSVAEPFASELDQFDCITVWMILQGATGGDLNVTLQTSPDGGSNWFDWFRSSDIVDGTSAFALKVSPILESTPTVVGTETSPALTKGTVAPGLWGSQMRVVFEAGSGTSAGATQTILLECHKA